MLEIAKVSLNLKDLETRLQTRLQKVLDITPLDLSCLLREDNLLILVHSPESTPMTPKEVFPELRAMLEQESIPEHLQIQMYLIVHGKQSYKQALDGDITLETPLFLPPVSEPDQAPSFFKLVLGQFCALKSRLTPRLVMMISGGGVGLVFLLGCLYGVTRPCVLGQCQTIPQAQQLAQESLALFETSNPDLKATKLRLNQAIRELEQIPRWSSYHHQAVSLLNIYQARSDSLDKLLLAVNQATKAVSLAENTPLPVTQWQTILKTWEEAITPLNQIPVESPFYSFAQVKRGEYQRQLALIQQRLQTEKEAIVNLESAEELAKIAKARHSAAQSAADWQLVQANWENAIQQLQAIAPGTTVYKQGKQLLETYIIQLTNANARKNQEELALKYYNKALEEGKKAEKYQEQNQWSAAVSAWRNSLTYLKQISANTFQFKQAQPLITAYTLSLTQAEANLKVALKLLVIQQDLAQTCSPQICNYNINPNGIKVKFTEAYMQQIWQTALEAKAQNNVYGQIEILNHISRLEQTWQMISNKSKKRIDVYNNNDQLMVSYEPK